MFSIQLDENKNTEIPTIYNQKVHKDKAIELYKYTQSTLTGFI